MREGADPSDLRVLMFWFRENYPDKMEGHEMLITLLSSEGDPALAEALDTLEDLYRRKGKLETRAKFLQEHRAKVVVGEAGSAGTGMRDEVDDPDQVKVKLDGNIYELMQQKAHDTRISVTGRDWRDIGSPGTGGPFGRLAVQRTV